MRAGTGILLMWVDVMIRETAQELRAIAVSCSDGAGYFAALYSRVTSQIAVSIDEGRFEDGERMDAFATAFAGRYTRALHQEDRRSRCWQACWDVAGDARLLITQHLLLGINAHVNYDLPQAVVEVGRKAGALEAARSDFDAVNDVLDTTSREVVRDLDRASRWANELSRLGGGRAFNFSFRVARARAWSAAERLYALDDGPQQAYLAELDRLVSVLAYLITRPVFPVGLVVPFARRFEQHDPRVVTTELLGET